MVMLARHTWSEPQRTGNVSTFAVSLKGEKIPQVNHKRCGLCWWRNGVMEVECQEYFVM